MQVKFSVKHLIVLCVFLTQRTNTWIFIGSASITYFLIYLLLLLFLLIPSFFSYVCFTILFLTSWFAYLLFLVF